jgi:hypothetical protein
MVLGTTLFRITEQGLVLFRRVGKHSQFSLRVGKAVNPSLDGSRNYSDSTVSYRGNRVKPS